ncbi:hypothetical protein LCGC14_1099470 [marine sediment metagenome]|uniref:Xylose isomerase-like TIM barrel domain-containing protein n=1 Tax=marine sediment metagenome TaxID=412755 RepID=A0A0F9MXT0_9ZZZZ|nr:sugar phosphate isomerase/epimerase [Phycisphaerae bacterium]HDZ42609.1 sugar phosphate isomerase/epimerase [Phycisphaerae bacterium]
MRLGAADGTFAAPRVDDLSPLCEKLDTYGLSAIIAPPLWAMTDGQCEAYGAKARSLGLTIGEAFYFANMLTRDEQQRSQHIDHVRSALAKAERMGCGSVITLVGTNHPSDNPTHPHPTDPYMFSPAAAAEFREIVLRILDGLDLANVKYIIEPWNNTFFYQPEDIREFIDSVDHPMLGLHLDQMNMVSQDHYYRTTDLIDRTFDLLADKVFSVHLKDVLFTRGPGDFMAFKEVLIGEGSMDYETYLRRLAHLPADTPCYCEHLATEADYALNFARLHHIARVVGTSFAPRMP